ncbi:GntP family transporter [Acidipropionibacterium thoenii]|uniref:GntP family transporter n=1 Tax=Acidipropionibacterium thoenii TaxID=1751 RepID=UPI000483F15D|nr:GntP family transporter [Acidipropionibacterium thoenii]
MSTGVLLTLALLAIALLLFLVIKLKMSAFVALMMVSLLLAIATGIPLADIADTMTKGMGNTLGSVATVVALGAMLGSLIEGADGANTLARKFTDVLGKKRVAIAVTAVAFLVGIPIFFEVGFIILAPIVFSLAFVTRTKLLKIALPVGAAILTVHVAIPPHPGPTAAAATLGAQPGLMILIGIPVCAVVVAVGYFVSKKIPIDDIVLGNTPIGMPPTGEEEVSETAESEAVDNPTGPGLVLFLILAPVIQILIGTVGKMLVREGTLAHSILSLVGAPLVALLVAVLLAYLTLGRQHHWSLSKRGHIIDDALPNVAVVVFVAGAGGVFASVLVASGIGKALAGVLISAHLPLIVAAFVISLALRGSQGSATVAILTTAGLLASSVAQGGFDAFHTALIALAIGFGSLGLSHINDGGFWIVTKYTGLCVADGLRTWTVLTTVCGLVGFALIGGLWLI